MINFGNVSKLSTKEDNLFVHKLLGFLVLGHFIYRFYRLVQTGSFNITSKWDIFFVVLHGLLSASSIIFHIPKPRNQTGPMIYPELRLHTIIFTLRSVVCCLIGFYTTTWGIYYKMLACFLTMISADLTTHYLREPNTKSPIRYVPFKEDTSVALQTNLKYWYSSSQVFATIYMIKSVDCAFIPLFPIQLATFLMTLVRKNIIKPTAWHQLYTLSLWSNIFVVLRYTPYEMMHQHGIVILFRLLRFNLNCNKYLVWAILFTIYVFTIDLKISGFEWFNEKPNTIASALVIILFLGGNIVKVYWYSQIKDNKTA